MHNTGQGQTRREFLNASMRSSFALGSAFLSFNVLGGVARAQAPAKGRSEPITLRFWHQEPDPRSIKALQEMADEFNKLHPDIIVKPQAMGWLDLELKVISALAAGNPPEIADTFTHHAGWAVSKNLLRPLDDVVASVGKEGWYHELLDWLHWDEHYWAVPMTWGTDMFLYRKDWADEKGFTEFKTWDDWLNYSKAMTNPPRRYGCTLWGNTSLGFNEDVYEMVGANGGHLWDDDGNPTYTNDAVYGMLEQYKELQAVLPPGWLSHGYVDTLNNWATQRAACLRGWGRTIGYILQYAPKGMRSPDIFAATTMPIGPGGSKGWTQSNDDIFVIYKDSTYPDEAAEFLKFYYRPENHRKFCLTVPIHLLPATKAVANDPEYQNHPTIKQWKIWEEPQWTALNNRWIAPLFMTKLSHRTLPHLTEIAHSGVLGEMVLDVVSNGMTPQDAAAKAEKKTEELLKEVRIKKG